MFNGNGPMRSFVNGGNYDDRNKPTGFMVRKEGKKGDYWSGSVDLGGGKLVKLTMFENTKDGCKSEFIVKVTKKSYEQKKNYGSRW